MAAFLSGCNGDDIETIRAKLPEGCTIQYLGRHDNNLMTSVPIYAVFCKGRDATTTSWSYRAGKHPRYAASVTFE